MNRKRFTIWEKWRKDKYSADLKKLQENLAARGMATSSARIQEEAYLKDEYLSEVDMERSAMEAEEAELKEIAKDRTSQRWTNGLVAGGSVIAAVGSIGSMVLALPHFSNQINNIEVKVDSLQESIEQMYGRSEKQVFTHSEINNHITAGVPGGSIIRLKLAHVPIKESVNVWWGSMSLSPIYVDVQGQEVVLNFVDHSPEDMITNEQEYQEKVAFTVSYIRAE